MSPILVRPVREQLEHDRVIRLLQAKYKRKFDVAINPGHEQTAPVGAGPSPWFPDLVLHSTERGRRLAGVVEVETAESVNNLEAMSQWAAFAKQRADFHLYVPAVSIDVTRRLCADNAIEVTELWAYHSVGEQIRFMLVQRAPGASPERTPAKAAKVAVKPAAKAPAKPAAKPVAKLPVKAAKAPAAARSAKPVAAKSAATKRPAVAVRAGSRPEKSGARKSALRPSARAAAKSARRR